MCSQNRGLNDSGTRNSASSRPSTSSRRKPDRFSAAGLNSMTRLRASMARIAIGASVISARVSACRSASWARSLAWRIWVATMAATACAVRRASSFQVAASPIRASAHRHWPSTGTE